MVIDVLLINGITLPYPLLDKGVECNSEGGSTLRVVFIYRNNLRHATKTIEIPADTKLNIPDFTERKAEQNLETLIRTNAHYTKSFFTRKQIAIDTVVMASPSVDNVAEALSDCRHVYVNRDSFAHSKDFAFVDFLYESLLQKLGSKLQPVTGATPRKITK